MKKILLALAIASTSLVLLNSCTKEYITNNSYLPGISYTPTVVPADWKPVAGATNIYAADLTFSELDATYYNSGTVQVALEFDNAKGFFNAIPATIKNVHYSFDYAVGSVTIFAEILPGGNTSAIDRNIKAKITLTDADNGGS